MVGGEGVDFFMVYAVTNPGGGHNSLSAFIVERNIEADIHLSSEEAVEEKVYE